MTRLEEIVKNTSGETREAFNHLVHSLAESIKEKRILEQKNNYVVHENRLLRKRLFGSSSEKNKLCDETDIPYQSEMDALFNEFELCAQEVELEQPPALKEDAKKPPKKKCGRKPLPKELEREVVIHDLADEEKVCGCGNTMSCIGHDVSEQLEYQPAIFKVIEHRCNKYVCNACSYSGSNV